MLDRTIAPPFNRIQKIVIKQPEKQTLRNGIDLFSLRSGSQEVLQLDILINTGKYNEVHNGSAFFAGKMLSEGIPGMSSSEISELLDSLGAQIDINPGLDQLEISIHCLSKHFLELSGVLKDMLTSPTIPEKELDTLKNIRLQSLHVNNEKSGFVASKLFRESLFGSKHPYGIVLNDDDILSTNQMIVQDYVRENIINQPFTLIASGNYTDQILESIVATFEGIDIGTPNVPDIVESTSLGGNIYEEKNDAVQTSIRIGCTSLSMNHPDYLTLLVTNEILGGYFGSRLMKNIREEKGLTYGISSGIAHLTHGNYFIVSADVKKENREEAIEEIKKEISILQTQLVSDDELDTVRNYMLGQIQSSVNTPFELAAKFKLLFVHGLDYSYYTSLIHTINHVTPGEILEISNKSLPLDSMRVISVG